MDLEIHLLSMKSELIPAVVSLERQCDLSSRSEESYLSLLQNPDSVLLVALNGFEQVVGVFSGWIVAGEFEIDNIAVSPTFRHQGIASKLLEKATELAQEKGVQRAVLEVRSNNQAACLLYEKFGFMVAGRRKNYYQNPSDDALIMAMEFQPKISFGAEKLS
jgi:ribosomal-protein-alanine N-acetyltransferase